MAFFEPETVDLETGSILAEVTSGFLMIVI